MYQNVSATMFGYVPKAPLPYTRERQIDNDDDFT